MTSPSHWRPHWWKASPSNPTERQTDRHTERDSPLPAFNQSALQLDYEGGRGQWSLVTKETSHIFTGGLWSMTLQYYYPATLFKEDLNRFHTFYFYAGVILKPLRCFSVHTEWKRAFLALLDSPATWGCDTQKPVSLAGFVLCVFVLQVWR